MLIVWGKKVRRVACGHSIDFCTVCRERRAFLAHEFRAVSHVYFVPMGKDARVAVELVCPDCASVFAPDVRTFRAIRNFDPTQLEAATPDLVRQREQLERRATSRQLTAEEREGLIAEPFILLRYLATKQARGGSESVTAVITLLAIVLTLAAVFVLYEHKPAVVTIPVVSAGVVLWAWSIARVLASPRQAVSGRVFDLLVQALSPIKPSLCELETVLGKLQAAKCPVGSHVKARELQNAIDLRAAARNRA